MIKPPPVPPLLRDAALAVGPGVPLRGEVTTGP